MYPRELFLHIRNPYALVPAENGDGEKLVALDAKVNFDDNALFKHTDVESMRNPEELSADETAAKAAVSKASS